MRHLVRLPTLVLGLALATALAAAPVHATDATPVAQGMTLTPNPRPAEAPAAPATTARRPGPSPLAAEIASVLQAERTLLQRLETEARAASGTEAALALQRQIAQVKQNTEIELLRVQARHARREGRVEVADAIDAVVRELLMTPEERAAAERARVDSAPAPGVER